MIEIHSGSTNETISLGKRLSHHLQAGDIIGLFGQLGSGKTTLIKGIARGLGIDKPCVISPSFVLVKEYPGKIPLYHLDLYRLKNLKSIYRLGLEEYLNSAAISVIEWADRMRSLLPDEYLHLELSIKGRGSRIIKIIPYGKSLKARFRKVSKKLL